MTKTILKQMQSIVRLINEISFLHEDNPRGSSNQFMFSNHYMMSHITKLKTKLHMTFASYLDSRFNFYHIPYVLDFSNLKEASMLHEYIKHHQQFKLLSSKIIIHSKEYSTVGKLIITYQDYPFYLHKDIYNNGLKHVAQFESYNFNNKEVE
jgi:hypothetical protein